MEQKRKISILNITLLLLLANILITIIDRILTIATLDVNITPQFIIMFILLIGTSISILIILYSSFKPIKLLFKAINDLSQKKLNTRVNIKSGSEIGQIGTAFDGMNRSEHTAQ